jgi:hypothetical protein
MLTVWQLNSCHLVGLTSWAHQMQPSPANYGHLHRLSYKVLSPLMFLGYILQFIDQGQFSAEEKRVWGLFTTNS